MPERFAVKPICGLTPVLLAGLWVTGPFQGGYVSVSPFALLGLPDRMKRVTPGMTEGQMWQALAVVRGGLRSAGGSGPLSDCRMG